VGGGCCPGGDLSVVGIVGSATTDWPPGGDDFFLAGAEPEVMLGVDPGWGGGPRGESEDNAGDTLPKVGDADFLPKGCARPKRELLDPPALSDEADEDGDKLRMSCLSMYFLCSRSSNSKLAMISCSCLSISSPEDFCKLR